MTVAELGGVVLDDPDECPELRYEYRAIGGALVGKGVRSRVRLGGPRRGFDFAGVLDCDLDRGRELELGAAWTKMYSRSSSASSARRRSLRRFDDEDVDGRRSSGWRLDDEDVDGRRSSRWRLRSMSSSVSESLTTCRRLRRSSRRSAFAWT